MTSDFTRANRERLNVFPSDTGYRFRKFFDEPGLFASLQPFYDDASYRFEVPEGRFDQVADLLESYGYDTVVVEDVEPFVVAYRRFSDHPRVLFKHAVDQRRTERYTLFLLNSREAVATAVDRGAVELHELDNVTW